MGAVKTKQTAAPVAAPPPFEVVQNEVLRLVAENNDRADPLMLVQAAKHPASPLHHLFEWDDAKAGEGFRLVQAGILIRRVKMTIIRPAADSRSVTVTTTRAVVSVPTERGAGSYGRTEVVMSDEDRRQAVLDGLVRELKALRQRHSDLSALAQVWAAVDMIGATASVAA